jgi:hypothetical protein
MHAIVQDHETSYNERGKQLVTLLKILNRGIRYTSNMVHVDRHIALRPIDPPWEFRLRDVSAFAANYRDKTLQRELDKFLSYLKG